MKFHSVRLLVALSLWAHLFTTTGRSEAPPYELIHPGTPAEGQTAWREDGYQLKTATNIYGDIAGKRQPLTGPSSIYLWKASQGFTETTALHQYLATLGQPMDDWTVAALNDQRHVLLINTAELPHFTVLWRPEAANQSDRFVSLTPSPGILSATVSATGEIFAYIGGSASTGWQPTYAYTAPGQSAWLPLNAPPIDGTTPGRPIYGTSTAAGQFVGYTFRGPASAPLSGGLELDSLRVRPARFGVDSGPDSQCHPGRDQQQPVCGLRPPACG